MGKIISNGIEYTGGSGSGVSSWNDLQNKPTNIAYIDEETETVDVETPIELTRDDIVNDLNSVDTTKALSARQGYELNKILTDIVGADIAEYSEDATYAIGDYCIYLNTLYRCHTAITIPIAWDGNNHWEATTFSNEISELNRKLPQFETGVLVHTVSEKEATDCVIWIAPYMFHTGAKYICINGISGDKHNGLLNYIYNQTAHTLIIYGLTTGEILNIAYVAIM